MIKKLLSWFRKDGTAEDSRAPENTSATFVLKLDDVTVGYLDCKDGLWYFKYDDEFKQNKEKFYPIAGFPNLDKVYSRSSLWPFFQVRIPGLKQPRVKEIIQKEGIDVNNELELLKRFGSRVISNPYTLGLS